MIPPDVTPDEALLDAYRRPVDAQAACARVKDRLFVRVESQPVRFRFLRSAGAGFGAAAAAMALTVCGVWWSARPSEPAFSKAELARATEEVQLVLALTGRALDRVERVALHEVLVEQALPAAASIPIRWPAADTPSTQTGSRNP